MDKAKLVQAAKEAYLKKGYSCSESILFALREEGVDIPASLFKAVAGLRAGIGGSGCVCGALIGATLALGYLIDEKDKGQVAHLSAELHNKFKERFKSTCCRALTRGYDFNSLPRREFCSGLVENMTDELIRLLPV